jgi:hypothetical protein
MINAMPGSYEPKLYRIRLKEHLDMHWEEWFEGMSFIYEGDSTLMEGDVADNASLFSILDRIQELNLTIISLEHVQVKSSGHNT